MRPFSPRGAGPPSCLSRTPHTAAGASAAGASGPSSARRSARPGWSPPKSVLEKDQLIEKLVHDNEVLMKEVAELDAQLRQAIEEREAAVAANQNLLHEQQEQESTSSIGERLQRAMDAQTEMVRSEREEQAKQHAADREFMNGVFRELEAQLAFARTEREEMQTRAERERRGATKKIKELEDGLALAIATKDRIRADTDREKEQLSKQFEQRIAGLRLEKEQAKLDKALMRRLEKELAELKALSIAHAAQTRSGGYGGAEYGGGRSFGGTADSDFDDLADVSEARRGF
jgi:hypothetical protein